MRFSRTLPVWAIYPTILYSLKELLDYCLDCAPNFYISHCNKIVNLYRNEPEEVHITDSESRCTVSKDDLRCCFVNGSYLAPQFNRLRGRR